MNSEIGSDFWEYDILIENIDKELFFWENENYNTLFLKSGRNAIKALCKILQNKKNIALPEYTCDTVIQPFVDEGFKVHFYGINKDLSIDSKSLLDCCDKHNIDIVLFHSFFGFNTSVDETVLNKLQEHGILIVEDTTQSLLKKHYYIRADYYICSFRKFFAIPDGGALISKNKIELKEIKAPDLELVNTARYAFKLKKEYFLNETDINKARFREEYQKFHMMIDLNKSVQAMSSESQQVLFSCNRRMIINRRVENYNQLARYINKTNKLSLVIYENDKDSVPLYCPVYVDNRTDLQDFLAKRRIYCPIVWPKSSFLVGLSEDAEYMYDHMLCIPIDQRYGNEDIERIIIALKEWEEK